MSGYVENGNMTFPVDGAIAEYRRVKISGGVLALAGATEKHIGVTKFETFAGDTICTVHLANAQGSKLMVAAGAIAQWATVYGAADGKIDDVANENRIGIALQSASGNGSIIEVLEFPVSTGLDSIGDIDGNLVIDEHFVGDWPAAGTALSGQGQYSWTKVETNGLGVISQDVANGVLKFSFDAVAEAATAALYMVNSPIAPSKGGIVEFMLAVYDIGDDAALDIDFGLASDTHATDFESIAEFVAFHLDGTDLSLKCHSDDGTTDTAAVDTTVDLVDDTFYKFKIDFSDLSDVKFYYGPIGGDYVRVASGSTFDVSNASANWTPIVLVEKTSNDTTADVRLDRVRAQVSDPYAA